MKIGHKLTVAALVTSTVAAAALLLPPAPKAQAQGRGTSVSGTIYGTLDFAQAAWVGHVIVSLDKEGPAIGTFVDHNNTMVPGKNGVDGTETISVTLPDGTFDIVGRFASNALTPGLFSFHETGTVKGKTGRYLHASGQVSIQGLAAGMPPSPEGGVPMWIAEIHGVVLGVE